MLSTCYILIRYCERNILASRHLANTFFLTTKFNMFEESQNKRGGVSNYSEGSRGNTNSNRGNDGHRGNTRGQGRGHDFPPQSRGQKQPAGYGNRRGCPTPQQQGERYDQERYSYNQEQQQNRHGSSKGYGFRQQHSRDGDPLVTLSKSLSYLLRHGAERQKMKLLPGGFLYVQDILKMPQFHEATEAHIKKVVEVNEKKRFFLKTDQDNKLMIRANQGHTIEVEDLELTPVTNPADLPTVVHGTYHNFWELIKNQGLKRFERNHIHFAAGLPGEDGVISGMRSSCQVLIYINAEKAIKGGIKFFRSANNVILSPGDENGVIGPCYFENVVNRKPWHKLDFDPNVNYKPHKKRKADEVSRDSGRASSKEGEQRRKGKQELEIKADQSSGHEKMENDSEVSSTARDMANDDITTVSEQSGKGEPEVDQSSESKPKKKKEEEKEEEEAPSRRIRT